MEVILFIFYLRGEAYTSNSGPAMLFKTATIYNGAVGVDVINSEIMITKSNLISAILHGTNLWVHPFRTIYEDGVSTIELKTNWHHQHLCYTPPTWMYHWNRFNPPAPSGRCSGGKSIEKFLMILTWYLKCGSTQYDWELVP